MFISRHWPAAKNDPPHCNRGVRCKNEHEIHLTVAIDSHFQESKCSPKEKPSWSVFMVFFSSPILILALHNNVSFFFYGIRVNFREPSSIFDESLWNSLRIPTTPSLCVSLMRRTYMRIRSILINTFFETHAQSMRERLPWPLRGHQPNPNRVFFFSEMFSGESEPVRLLLPAACLSIAKFHFTFGRRCWWRGGWK